MDDIIREAQALVMEYEWIIRLTEEELVDQILTQNNIHNMHIDLLKFVKKVSELGDVR